MSVSYLPLHTLLLLGVQWPNLLNVPLAHATPALRVSGPVRSWQRGQVRAHAGRMTKYIQACCLTPSAAEGVHLRMHMHACNDSNACMHACVMRPTQTTSSGVICMFLCLSYALPAHSPSHSSCHPHSPGPKPCHSIGPKPCHSFVFSLPCDKQQLEHLLAYGGAVRLDHLR